MFNPRGLGCGCFPFWGDNAILTQTMNATGTTYYTNVQKCITGPLEDAFRLRASRATGPAHHVRCARPHGALWTHAEVSWVDLQLCTHIGRRTHGQGPSGAAKPACGGWHGRRCRQDLGKRGTAQTTTRLGRGKQETDDVGTTQVPKRHTPRGTERPATRRSNRVVTT